jgi:probable HAF family extracellular repeat protein
VNLRFSARILTLALFVSFSILLPLAGQNTPFSSRHHHFKLVDLGTLGGTDSNVPIVFDEINGSAGAQAISDQGIVAGTADTSAVDPLCYFDDCYYPNAFRWQDGTRIALSPLSGGSYSSSNWVSRNGLVAGISENGQNDPLTGLPVAHAVLWQNSQVIDVGTLLGGYESFAWGVNNSGQVVGFSTNETSDPYSYFYSQILGFTGGTQTRAFFWDQHDGMEDLGTLGGPDAWAAIVNDHGQVAGISYTSSTPNADNGPACPPGFPTQDPFFWDKNSGMVDVGNFGGTCAVPQAFNNRGQMVGQSYLAGNSVGHAFLWERNGHPRLKDLGTLGGDNAAALWIDDAGDIVGYADIANPPGCNDLTCVHHAVWWKHGRANDLGSIGTDPCSRAISINSRGQIVGLTAAVCGGNATHGVLWEEGGPAVDLNSLVTDADMALTTPSYINDRGEIAGLGLPSNCSNIDVCGHAFLLIPCDADHPGVEGCDYSMLETSSAGSVRRASHQLFGYAPAAAFWLRTHRLHFRTLSPRN